MDTARIFLSYKKIIIPASKIAKYKTASQMIAIFITLCLSQLGEVWWISTILLIPALLFSYISFVDYIYKIVLKIKK